MLGCHTRLALVAPITRLALVAPIIQIQPIQPRWRQSHPEQNKAGKVLSSSGPYRPQRPSPAGPCGPCDPGGIQAIQATPGRAGSRRYGPYRAGHDPGGMGRTRRICHSSGGWVTILHSLSALAAHATRAGSRRPGRDPDDPGGIQATRATHSANTRGALNEPK